MGIGQVISDTFGMVKERFGSLLGLWAIYFGIIIAMFVVFGIGIGVAGVAGLNSMAEGNMLAVGGGLVVLVIVFYLAYILVAMAQYASLIAMASPLQRPTFGAALSTGWRAAPALLLLMVVLLIAYFALSIVIGLLTAALGDAGVVVLLAVVVLAIWVGCRLAPIYAVVAVDGVRNPFTAISRSWALTRGHVLKILAASVIFLVILLIVCGLLLLPSIGLLSSLSDPSTLADPNSAGAAAGGIFLLLGGFLLASVIFTVCYGAFMAVIHSSLSTAAGEGTAEAFA